MTVAAVRTWLKVMDPTALTARETLQRALGYGRRLGGIQRSEIWVFRWEGEVDAQAILARLIHDTNLIQNPNKHHLETAGAGEALHPRGNVWVLIYTPGAGRTLEGALSRHGLVSGEVPRVRRGVLWEIEIEGPEKERLETAREIAVTRARKQGLLSNPHVSDVAVFARPPAARDLADRLLDAQQETPA